MNDLLGDELDDDDDDPMPALEEFVVSLDMYITSDMQDDGHMAPEQ